VAQVGGAGQLAPPPPPPGLVAGSVQPNPAATPKQIGAFAAKQHDAV